MENKKLQVYLEKAYDSDQNQFNLIDIKSRIGKELDGFLEERKEENKKYEILSNYDNTSFEQKKTELKNNIESIDTNIKFLEDLLNIDVKDLAKYIQTKRIQINTILTSKKELSKEQSKLKYEEIFNTFSEDKDFLKQVEADAEKEAEDRTNDFAEYFELEKKKLFFDQAKIDIHLYMKSLGEIDLRNTGINIAEDAKNRPLHQHYENTINKFSHILTTTDKTMKLLESFIKKFTKFDKTIPVHAYIKKHPEHINIISFLIQVFGTGAIGLGNKYVADYLEPYNDISEKLTKAGLSEEHAKTFYKNLSLSKKLSELNDAFLIVYNNYSEDVYKAVQKIVSPSDDNNLGNEFSSTLKLNKNKVSGLYRMLKSFRNLELDLNDETKEKLDNIKENFISLYQEHGAISIKNKDGYTSINEYIAKHSEDFESVSNEINEFVNKFLVKNNSVKESKLLALYIVFSSLISYSTLQDDNDDLSSIITLLGQYSIEEYLVNNNQGTIEDKIFEFISGYQLYLSVIIDDKDRGSHIPHNIEQIENTIDTVGGLTAFKDIVTDFSGLKIFYDNVNSYKKLGSTMKTCFNSESCDKGEDELNSLWDKIQKNIFKIPFDDPIILGGKYIKKYNEYTVELHRIESPHYFAIVKINLFDDLINTESDVRKLSDINDISIDNIKAEISKENYLTQDNIFSISDVTGDFGAIFLLHKDGSFSLDGLNSDGLRYVFGEEAYNKLSYVILSHIAETCNIIDLRNDDDNDKTKKIPGFHEDQDITFTDIRKVYDNTGTSPLSKNLNYKSSHLRILHHNMITGIKGRSLAKENEIPLYANIYKEPYNTRIDEPIESIRIDDIADEYGPFRAYLKELREEYNNEDTKIHFQTYVSEFKKEGVSYSDTPIKIIKLDKTKQN